jgi:hypothetical protein
VTATWRGTTLMKRVRVTSCNSGVPPCHPERAP